MEETEVRKLQYLVAMTLDGKIAQPDGTFGCFFLVSDEHHADYLESLKSFDTVLMGRSTYDVGLKTGVTDPYPHLTSYVFSKSLAEGPNPRVQIIREDPAGFVQTLKQQPGGPIYLCGGSKLAATLLDAGLIDEVVLKLNPLLIGEGIPLFAEVAAPILLELQDMKRYGNSVLLLTYRVKADPRALA